MDDGREFVKDINIETITMWPVKCVFCCNRLYKRDYTVMDDYLFEKIIEQYCRMGGGTVGNWTYAVRFFIRSFTPRKNRNYK